MSATWVPSDQSLRPFWLNRKEELCAAHPFCFVLPFLNLLFGFNNKKKRGKDSLNKKRLRRGKRNAHKKKFKEKEN